MQRKFDLLLVYHFYH